MAREDDQPLENSKGTNLANWMSCQATSRRVIQVCRRPDSSMRVTEICMCHDTSARPRKHRMMVPASMGLTWPGGRPMAVVTICTPITASTIQARMRTQSGQAWPDSGNGPISCSKAACSSGVGAANRLFMNGTGDAARPRSMRRAYGRPGVVAAGLRRGAWRGSSCGSCILRGLVPGSGRALGRHGVASAAGALALQVARNPLADIDHGVEIDARLDVQAAQHV